MGMLKRLLIFIIIILLLALLSYYWPQLTGNATNNQQQTNYEKEPSSVTKIVDGDTIHVKIDGSDKEEIIRLLGINTPEKNKPFYEEAKYFLEKEIENKTVELLRDIENTDRYERKLRYVFYDNKIINVEIIQEGLATTFMLDELKYQNKFINAEKFARDNKIGLWRKSQDSCANCIVLAKLEPIDDYFIIKNNCNKICNLSGWIVKDDANHFTYLDNLNAGEDKEYKSKTEIWNDAGDRFFMRDEKGDLVIFYEY